MYGTARLCASLILFLRFCAVFLYVARFYLDHLLKFVYDTSPYAGISFSRRLPLSYTTQVSLYVTVVFLVSFCHLDTFLLSCFQASHRTFFFFLFLYVMFSTSRLCHGVTFRKEKRRIPSRRHVGLHVILVKDSATRARAHLQGRSQGQSA